MTRRPSGSNFERLQNNGVNKSKPQVVEPGKTTTPKNHQFTGDEGTKRRIRPQLNSVQDVNGEVAANEKSKQKQQQRGAAAPPGS